MESISFRCPACDQEMQFPAARVGKGGKCTRCGKEFTINPAASTPPPPPPVDDDDDEGGKHYGLVQDPTEDPRKKLLPTKKKKDKSKAAIKKKRKTLVDSEQWAIVRHGLLLMSIGAMVWGGI